MADEVFTASEDQELFHSLVFIRKENPQTPLC